MIFENFMLFMNKILLFSSYINTASGFPKPLTPSEERECFEKFKAGSPACYIRLYVGRNADFLLSERKKL